MAVTEIHHIETTLNKAMDYISDEIKTDEGTLITTFNCGYKTAYIEFANTKKLMNSRSKYLGLHLRQSFNPEDDLTPEQAHEIGLQLIEKHLKGKYEYVLTTHTDKPHLHNHVIFNKVSFVDGKAYDCNKKSYHEIRTISDNLCKEYGLDYIENPYKGKSKKIGEVYARKNGRSYKAKLQFAIDTSIKKSKTWEQFLDMMHNYFGYEIKNGKHIAFRATDQERFTRAKTLGENYTEDNIKSRIDNRINNRIKVSSLHKKRSAKVVDIKSNQLAAESAGFAYWLKLQNLKNMAKSWSVISQNGVRDVNSFYETVNKIHDEYGQVQSKIREKEEQASRLGSKIKNINTYNKYKKIFEGYSKASDQDKYFRTYETEIMLFELAREELGDITKTELCSIPMIENEINIIYSDIKKLNRTLSSHKQKVKEINELKNNLETYMKENNKDIDKFID